MRAAAYVYAKGRVSMTSFNEGIDVRSRVIALAVMSPYTLAVIASLSDYGSLSPREADSPNNGVAQTYILIASRHKWTCGAGRSGTRLASVERAGITRLSYTNMIKFHLMDR